MVVDLAERRSLAPLLAACGPETHVRPSALSSRTHAEPLIPLAAEPHRAWGADGAEHAMVFTYREMDDESGLQYQRARSYLPSIGRMVQRDPILGNVPFEHYVYAGNSPGRNTDPTGELLRSQYDWLARKFIPKFPGVADESITSAKVKEHLGIIKKKLRELAPNAGFTPGDAWEGDPYNDDKALDAVVAAQGWDKETPPFPGHAFAERISEIPEMLRIIRAARAIVDADGTMRSEGMTDAFMIGWIMFETQWWPLASPYGPGGGASNEVGLLQTNRKTIQAGDLTPYYPAGVSKVYNDVALSDPVTGVAAGMTVLYAKMKSQGLKTVDAGLLAFATSFPQYAARVHGLEKVVTDAVANSRAKSLDKLTQDEQIGLWNDLVGKRLGK